jgi:hypothetical protein
MTKILAPSALYASNLSAWLHCEGHAAMWMRHSTGHICVLTNAPLDVVTACLEAMS